MERRAFVGLLPGLALSEPQMTSAPAASDHLTPRPYLSYDDWLEAARRASLGYLKDIGAKDTERFIHHLALWSIGIPRPKEPSWQEIEGANRPLSFATLSPGRPFVVTTFRMAPGCVQPAHCHPGGGGITICIEGGLTLRHFDLPAGQKPFTESGAEVEVRETSATLLTRETFTLFTPTRSNLHQLEAGPEGAWCIDLIAQWEGQGQFSYLRLSPESAALAPSPGQLLRGRWTGMKIADAYPRRS
jgi:hypothetical protein